MGLNTFIQEKTMVGFRHLIFSFVYWYNRQVLILLMICICMFVYIRAISIYGQLTLDYSRGIWINRVRLPKLLVVS